MQEGTVLRNNYRLERLLGRGGMADVYLAFDLRRQANVAVKVLRDDLAEDPEFVRRFAREAEALARLEHPNIVRFYSFERQGATAFIVMDYVPGSTLQRRLAEAEGPLLLEELTGVLRRVGAALQYAHTEGYVHRDIKPGNIMLREDGNALLSDFGIARAAESATLATVAMGTPAYMSPEQILGRELDRRTDIYSLGVVLYEAATGRRPFTGDERGITGTSTLARLREAHLKVTPPHPRAVNPALPGGVAEVILRALAKEPGQRWPDVVSLVQAWEGAAGQAGAGAAAAGVEPTLIAPSSADLRPRGSAPMLAGVGPTTPPRAAPPQSGRARAGGYDLAASQGTPPRGDYAAPAGGAAARRGRSPLPWLVGAIGVGLVVMAFLIWRLVAGGGAAAPKTPAVAAVDVEQTAQALVAAYTKATADAEATVNALVMERARLTAQVAVGVATPEATLPARPQPTAPATPVATAPPELQPTATATVEQNLPIPTTAVPQVPAVVVIQDKVNVREGPGTNYPVSGQATKDQKLDLTGKNAGGDWWQVCCVNDKRVWISSGLVRAEGDTGGVPVISNIPTPPPQVSNPQCQPWHKKPGPGFGILLVENHIGQDLYLEYVGGGSGKWTLPAKKGDVPGRWWQELPVGHHEFTDSTGTGHGKISLDIESQKSYISPIWFNDREQELVYPMDIPAGCR